MRINLIFFRLNFSDRIKEIELGYVRASIFPVHHSWDIYAFAFPKIKLLEVNSLLCKTNLIVIILRSLSVYWIIVTAII